MKFQIIKIIAHKKTPYARFDVVREYRKSFPSSYEQVLCMSHIS